MCNIQVNDTFYGENVKFARVMAVCIHSYICAVKGYGHIMTRRVFVTTWEVVLKDKVKLHNEKIYNL
jgi:uncharacterized Fe-S cluster protein YjdI